MEKWDMKRRYLPWLAAAFLLGGHLHADDIDQIEVEDSVVPVAPSAIPGMEALVEHIALDDRVIADGASCFGFQPDVDIAPDEDVFYIVSMCHEGGWQGNARAAVYKYSSTGELLAGPVPVSDGGEPFGFSRGWSVAAFPDGGCVAAGGARFGLGEEEGIDLGVYDTEVSGMRVFDPELNALTPLVGVWEPANQPGNDDRDGNVEHRPQVARLSNGRFVVALDILSANMQIHLGLTDTGDNPARKVVYRLFERDGTPAGPTRWAFPVSDEDGGWSADQNSFDLTAGPDGSFAIIAVAQGLLENGDPNVIRFFDNNGDPMGEPFGVCDPALVEFGGIIEPGIVSPEIGYGGGVFVSGVNLNLIGFGGNTMGVTLFDIEGNVLRSTYDGLRHKDLLPEVREGDLASDPSGNFFVVDRSDQAIAGAADADKIQFIQMHTREGVPFENSFTAFPPGQSAGSQRDPSIAAGANFFVIASLNEGIEGDINPHGGVNAFSVYSNPMEQTRVDLWMMF